MFNFAVSTLFQKYQYRFLLGICLLFLFFGPAINGKNLNKVSQERKYEVLEKTLPPDAIRINEVRNLNSPDFPIDFEIELQNISDKPIYAVNAAFYFKLNSTNRNKGFWLRYGRPELVNVNIEATEKDIPINPGEKCLLKPVQAEALGHRSLEKKDMFFAEQSLKSKWVLNFQSINHGDGTGFFVGTRHKKIGRVVGKTWNSLALQINECIDRPNPPVGSGTCQK